MSLADELMADLEEGFGEGGEELDTIEEDDEIEDVEDMQMEEGSVRAIARLSQSAHFLSIMNRMEAFHSKPLKKEIIGPVETDPEYCLIVEANAIANEIDNEINVIHKYVRDLYQTRFPELESLVIEPLAYMTVVLELGNHIEKVKNSSTLQNVITSATIMVVSVTASTTQGREMEESKLALVNEACELALELHQKKLFIFQYVESRMELIAPNLSAVVGAETAAKLMGVAGGLTNLARMPACNVLVLGAQRKTLAGFSSTLINPHTGFLFTCKLAASMPPDLRQRAAKLLASKASLSSRVDLGHSAQDGSVGRAMRADIDGKLEKAQEPPPVKETKALPVPLEGQRRKRGGRRHRKMKERFGLTELKKQQGRINFGDIEEEAYQNDLGVSLGSLAKAAAGKSLRGPIADAKTKARVSKSLQQKIAKQNTWGGTTTVKKTISGTSSSIAFTPLQGLEIVNPSAKDAANSSGTQSQYFSSTGSFYKVGGK